MGSRSCAVHLKDIGGDIDRRIFIHPLELKRLVVRSELKSRDEFRGGFLSPPAEKYFAGEGRNMTGLPDELLIESGQRIYRRSSILRIGPSQYVVCMAFSASVRVCYAASLCLSCSKNARRSRFLGGQ